MGPVEGWIALLDGNVYIVKGCEHPLPCLHVIPRRIRGVKVDAFEGCPSRHLRWSFCLASRVCMLCPWDEPRLLNPVEVLESRLAKFRDPIVDVLYSVAPRRVGLTGSIAYGEFIAGVKPRDVDIVVYGLEASRAVLEAVLELWARGVATPVDVEEYRAVRREISEASWRCVAAANPLVFRAYGKTYSVKLVACDEPTRCREPLARSVVREKLHIIKRLTPCTVPARYLAVLPDGSRIELYTLRSYLACLQVHTLVAGVFSLEAYPGYTRLVPDGRVAVVQVLQA